MATFLGIESGDQFILDEMNKKVRLEEYRRGITELNKRGILTYASTMIGFPGETVESARNTMRFLNETQPTFYSLGLYFHETKVPIAERKEELALRGAGYGWSHKTMDWRQASELIKEGLQTIQGPSIIPLYCFNVWSVGYYESHGIPREQILEFLRLATPLCGVEGGEAAALDPKHEERLLSVFRSSQPTAATA